jgi:hypothetical protein
MPMSARLAALALLLAFSARTAAAQAEFREEEERDAGPRGPYLTLTAGRYDPTGPSLEGFPAGTGIAARAGWRFGSRYAFELEVRRSVTTLEGAGPASLEIRQTSFVPSLRVFGSIGPVATEGALGLGWFSTNAELTGVPGTGQGRLGFRVDGGLGLPVGRHLTVLAGLSYGGAYATLFEEPTWVAGLTAEVGLRLLWPVQGE